MANTRLNHLFYYYIHFRIKEKFNDRIYVCCSEVENFIAQKFRTPRQIKRKVLLDLQELGLVQVLRGDKLKINQTVMDCLYL